MRKSAAGWAGGSGNHCTVRPRNQFDEKESMSKLEKDMALKEHEAKSRIAAAQDKAMQEIARQTTELTINAVKKLLSSKLSAKMQDKLIDESIDVIAKQKKV